MAAPAIYLLAVALSGQAPDSSAVTPDAAAPCVSAETTSPLYSPPAYQIEPDSSVPPAIVAAAEGAWNNPDCNSGGTAFPSLTPTAVPGARQVFVSYVNGLNPRNNSSCGQTTPVGTAYSITIYSQARGPSGSIGSCGSTAAMTQSLEHEFGHLLDLNDSTCPGYIMGPVAFPPKTGPLPPQPLSRSIQPAECAEANQFNITPAEQPPPQPPSVCPPDCTCPATCQSGCNADGVCLDDPCDTDPTLPECGGECGPECDGGPGGGGGGVCGPDDPCDDGGGVIILPPPSRLVGAQEKADGAEHIRPRQAQIECVEGDQIWRSGRELLTHRYLMAAIQGYP